MLFTPTSGKIKATRNMRGSLVRTYHLVKATDNPSEGIWKTSSMTVPGTPSIDLPVHVSHAQALLLLWAPSGVTHSLGCEKILRSSSSR